MPRKRNHKEYKDYGSHKYSYVKGGARRECRCGCWIEPRDKFGGPVGIDPFGHCPNNPLGGQK